MDLELNDNLCVAGSMRGRRPEWLYLLQDVVKPQVPPPHPYQVRALRPRLTLTKHTTLLLSALRDRVPATLPASNRLMRGATFRRCSCCLGSNGSCTLPLRLATMNNRA